MATTTATDQKTGSRKLSLSSFVPVATKTLMALHDVYVSADIYLLHEGAPQPTLFRSRSVRSTAENFRSLVDVDVLYVKRSEYGNFQSAIAAHLETILQRENIPAAWRLSALQAAMECEVDTTLRLIQCDHLVNQSQKMGYHISTLLRDSRTLPADLFQVLRHDYYTFTHMTNVSSYAVLLAEGLGIADQRELEEIAVGGLLHDVGKRLISPRILNKPKKLSDDEFETIKTHPQIGYEELQGRNDISRDQLMMVYQHHERIDGTGYPVRIMGDEMHLWSRLCAVVDVFDAMTCERPYRKPLGVGHVLSFMQQKAGSHLDKEMVRCWTKLMSAK